MFAVEEGYLITFLGPQNPTRSFFLHLIALPRLISCTAYSPIADSALFSAYLKVVYRFQPTRRSCTVFSLVKNYYYIQLLEYRAINISLLKGIMTLKGRRSQVSCHFLAVFL
jgi:hypothetical protein